MGNAVDGAKLRKNQEQIASHHQCPVAVDIADSKFDSTKNFDYIRVRDSIPIIGHNPRSEKLSKEALLERSCDQNEGPFAS